MSSREPLPDWLSYAPNHEMKPAVMFGLLSADRAVRQTELANEINNLQANLIGFSLHSPQQFCEQSLQPAGFTEQITVPYLKLGRYPATARGDQLTDQGVERGIALAGAVATWSLHSPDISLGEVLGKTVPTRHEGGMSHAQLRYKILSNLVTHGSLAVSEVADLSSDNSSLSAVVREMESEGILQVGRSNLKNARTFEIINPDYIEGERKRSFNYLVTERQFMFRTLRIAKKFRDVWQLDEFLDLAAAVDSDPELLQKLNNLMSHLLAPSVEGTQQNIRNVSGPLYDEGDRYTAVEISDKVEPAVRELVGIITSHISGDETAIREGTDQALQIMGSPQDMAELIAKPRRLSPLVIKDPHFSDRLVDIILASQSLLDARAIHKSYENLTGRKVGVQTITLRLWDIVKSGAIIAHTRPYIQGKTQAAPVYSVA